jgi:uncharacterized protein with GYD domain
VAGSSVSIVVGVTFLGPGVTWKESHATLGRFDAVDIVEAAKPEDVEKAAMIIRSYGHSSTETLLATPWKDFVSNLAG